MSLAALAAAPDDLLIPLPGPTEPMSPAGGAEARGLVESLLSELEPRIDPVLRDLAQSAVADRDPATSEAGAWSAFAAGLLVAGDAEVALWAGLRAARLEPSGLYLTNCGVYLDCLGRPAEARVLLEGARATGFRSPYLLEALASACAGTGDREAARGHIAEAAAMAPHDEPIQNAKTVLDTGSPPPPPQAEGDDLDRLLAELRRHFDDSHALSKRVLADLDRVYEERDAPRVRLAETIENAAATLLPVLEEMVSKAHLPRAEFLRAMGQPAETDENVYRMLRDMHVSSCYGQLLTAWFFATDTLIDLAGCNWGHEAYLWAAATGQDVQVYLRGQKQRDDDRPSVRDVIPSAYWDEYRGQNDRAARAWHDCQRAARDEAAQARCDYRLCQTRRALFERLQNLVESRYNVAAARFDQLAAQRLNWAEQQVLAARDYAQRCTAKMVFADSQAGRQSKELMLQGVQSNFDLLVQQRLLDPQGRSMTAFLVGQAQWFERQRAGQLEALGAELEQIERECEPVERKMLQILAQENWQAYLEYLRERMAGDFRAELRPDFDCEGGVGPLSLSLSGAGRLSGDAGNVGAEVDTTGSGEISGKFKVRNVPLKAKVSVKEGKFAGVTVGGSANHHYGPFYGETGVTLFGESRGGRMEYGFKARGRLGIGLGAGPAGARCWPGTAVVEFQARSFVEHAMDYYRATSTGERQPAR